MESRPFKIDGVAIATPTEYKIGIEDLSSENTGRTLDGVMHKDVVAVKDYYECVWKKLSFDDAQTILTATDGKTSVNFRHIDPRYPNAYITSQFYIGTRKCVAKNLQNKSWNDISMTFIRI